MRPKGRILCAGLGVLTHFTPPPLPSAPHYTFTGRGHKPMKLLHDSARLRYHAPAAVCLLLIAVLLLLPTGFEDTAIYQGADGSPPG